ncbi:MAG: hypothetical protein LIO71_03005 [Ruminococcus sp.]|nr:hypothetical protein [Ruminococcus sp.]
MNSFTITSIEYDASAKKLTFNFSDNLQKVCLGIETIDEVSEAITKIIKKISA